MEAEGMPPAPAESGVEDMAAESAPETVYLPAGKIRGLDKLEAGDTATVTIKVRCVEPTNSADGGEYSEGHEVEILEGSVSQGSAGSGNPTGTRPYGT